MLVFSKKKKTAVKIPFERFDFFPNFTVLTIDLCPMNMFVLFGRVCLHKNSVLPDYKVSKNK